MGSDADIVVWKTDSERHLAVESSRLEIQHSNVANSFESVESDAGPSVVISRGKIMYADDQVRYLKYDFELIVVVVHFLNNVYAGKISDNNAIFL